MKLLTTIFLFSFTLSFAQPSQSEVTNSIVNGDKDGWWKEPTGHDEFVYSIAEYKNGLKNGKAYFYRGNDRVGMFTFYHEDEINGFHRILNEDGTTRILSEYSKGKLNGTKIVFSTNSVIERIENYKKGKLHGLYCQFYPNGNLFYRYFYKEGITDGDYTMYLEDGSLRFKGQYQNDKKVGNWYKFNSNADTIDIETFD